jgi:hypothetical protein
MFYPLIVILLGMVAPSSTRNLIALDVSSPIDALITFKQALVAAWTSFLGIDGHEKISALILLLAAIWTKHLQNGVPFFLRLLMVTFFLACLTDGALHVMGLSSSTNTLRSSLLMSLEPLIIGLSAAIMWAGLRILLMTLYPDYSRSKAHRDTLTDLDQN